MSLPRSSTLAGRTAVPAPQQRSARPGYRFLIVTTWVAALGLTVWFVRSYLRQFTLDESPAATPAGRWFGILGTLLFAVLVLYGWRRVSFASRAGRLPWWYRAHLLLGVLALALMGCHSGFAFRAPLLDLLQVAFWGTMLTGVYGWSHVAMLRRWLARHEWQPMVWNEIRTRRSALDGVLAASLADLDADDPARAAVGAARAAMTRRRAANLWRLPDWKAWEVPVHDCVPAGIRQLLEEQHQLEALFAAHRLMRGWTTLHLLFAAAAVQLVVWHVVSVIRY